MESAVLAVALADANEIGQRDERKAAGLSRSKLEVQIGVDVAVGTCRIWMLSELGPTLPVTTLPLLHHLTSSFHPRHTTLFRQNASSAVIHAL